MMGWVKHKKFFRIPFVSLLLLLLLFRCSDILDGVGFFCPDSWSKKIQGMEKKHHSPYMPNKLFELERRKEEENERDFQKE